MFVKDGAAVRQAGFFQGYSTIVVVVILLQVSGGACVRACVCACVRVCVLLNEVLCSMCVLAFESGFVCLHYLQRIL